MERLDEDELFWLEHVVDKKVIDPGQVRRLVAEVRDLRAEREPVHPREQLDLDTVYYMSCTDDKCEFSLEQVRQLGTEVIESRRLIRELLAWADELEASKNLATPRWVAAEVRRRLGL